MVVLIIDGHPKAQPRPRAFAMRFGDDKVRARMYDAGTAENWKSLIALAARPHQPASPTEGAICLRLQFFLPRPKSRSRKCDPPGPTWCTSKPDAENLAKPVMDCLTQLGWWNDDSQVVELHVAKRYHAIGGRPGAVIEIKSLDGAASADQDLPTSPTTLKPAEDEGSSRVLERRPEAAQGRRGFRRSQSTAPGSDPSGRERRAADAAGSITPEAGTQRSSSVASHAALSHWPAEEPAQTFMGAGDGRHSAAGRASRGPGERAEAVEAAAPPSAAASAHSPSKET